MGHQHDIRKVWVQVSFGGSGGSLFQVLVTVNLYENYFVPETVLSVYNC